MPDVKKIIKNIVGEGFEAAKDSAKQIADTVSPGALLEQAIGPKSQRNEMSDYLKNIGDPNLTGDKLKQKEQQIKSEDELKLERTRRMLSGIPDHMRLPNRQKELSPYEETMKEEEKKAQAVEAQKKQQQQQVAQPTSKPKRGSLFAKKKSQAKGFEGLVKDSKVG